MRILSIFLLFIGLAFSVQAQYKSKDKKANEHYDKGMSFLDRGNIVDGVEELKEAIKLDSNYVDAYYVLADLYCQNGVYSQGISFYNNALKRDKRPPQKAYVLLGRAYMGDQQYEKAISSFKTALEDKDISVATAAGLKDMVEICAFRDSLVKNPVPFNPINMGKAINTEEEEYWPTITADQETFIFTRREKKGARPDGYPVMKEDFYISKKQADGTWGEARNVGSPINTRDNEGALALSPDGRFVYYIGCNRPDGEGSCDIYIAMKDGDLWKDPMNLKPVNTSRYETSPSFSSDGGSLFYSKGINVSKGKDIWMAYYDADKNAWNTPVELTEINTDREEIAPFIHPDGKTLYFASDGYPGMGGLDIFYTRKGADGKWSKPVNLGYPINTSGDEFGLSVNSTGDFAYISSGREGGEGLLDIYQFELYEQARPAVVTYSKGKVYDMFSKQPLMATFELIDVETEEVVVRSSSDSKTGEFLVCLPTNRDYALHVSKEGYSFYSENFSLTQQDSDKPYALDVPMQPIKKDAIVQLQNVFFETNKYDLLPQSQAELNKLVRFLSSSPKVKIEIGGHTDNRGDKQQNQLLSENRAKSVYDYLLGKGIAADRLSYKGYGDTMPRVANAQSEADHQKNRRTEFKILSVE